MERPWLQSNDPVSPVGPTIENLWRYLLSSSPEDPPWKDAIAWPPDIFALCVAVLRRSGAYSAIEKASTQDGDKMRSEGELWARRVSNSSTKRGENPNEVDRVWRNFQTEKVLHKPIHLIADDAVLLHDLRFLVGAADEAFRAFGSATWNEGGVRHKIEQLIRPTHFGSTLCKLISPTAARVLPKLHTPKSGLTIRSFSHYLSYCETDEVQPLWFVIPSAGGDVKNVFHFNVLIVPWPMEVRPKQIAAKGRSTDPRWDYFEYLPDDSGRKVAQHVASLCKEALKLTGSLDAVVMPELSVNVEDYRAIRDVVIGQGLVSVIGVGGKNPSGKDENRVCIDVPLSPHHYVHLRQRKHHRWRLDRHQIEQYGLAARLNRDKSYWEDIDLSDRKLLFLALRPWLVTSAVICEDLARHDPVGEVIRGVGPHLVIALLMDGPQISSRWSSRYAASLADDPGSSVLSVTTLGMTKLSRTSSGESQSRVVALWRDAKSGTREIALKDGDDAILMTICSEKQTELTADNRIREQRHDKLAADRRVRKKQHEQDGAYTAVLAGWHSVKAPKRKAANWPSETPGDPSKPNPVGAHAASVLAQLAQQTDVTADKPPALLADLEGEAFLIGQALWEMLAKWNQDNPKSASQIEAFKQQFIRKECSDTSNSQSAAKASVFRTALAIHEWARTSRFKLES